LLTRRLLSGGENEQQKTPVGDGQSVPTGRPELQAEHLSRIESGEVMVEMKDALGHDKSEKQTDVDAVTKPDASIMRTDPRCKAPALDPILEDPNAEDEGMMSTTDGTPRPPPQRKESVSSQDGEHTSSERSQRGSDSRKRPSRAGSKLSELLPRSQDDSYAVRTGIAMTNERALAVLNRIEKKLCGEFGG
jgi:hypothetical protein